MDNIKYASNGLVYDRFFDTQKSVTNVGIKYASNVFLIYEFKPVTNVAVKSASSGKMCGRFFDTRKPVTNAAVIC